MDEINFNILKSNIRELMRNNHITQQELSDVLGMSQSNLSKRLKIDDDSNCFTLAQICRLATYFNTSIDKLVGLSDKSTTKQYSVKEICSLFVYLIENHRFSIDKINKDEEEIEPTFDETSYRNRNVSVEYTRFFFSNYLVIPEYATEVMHDYYLDTIDFEGNKIPDNVKINKFINNYLHIFEIYDKGDLSEDAYVHTIQSLLDDINK